MKKILEDKKILNKDEIHFLFIIYDNLFIKINGEKKYFEIGLQQGHSESPLLFDIYFEDFIKILEKGCNSLHVNIFFRIYADDIVIKVQSKSLTTMLRKYQKLSNEYNFILGINKCNILCDRNHKEIKHIKKEKLLNIEISNEYNYLGIMINNYGSINNHLNITRKKMKYITNKLYYIIKDFSFDKKYYLYQVYVRPYLIYIAPIIST